MKLKAIALFAMLFALPATSASAVTVANTHAIASTSSSSTLHTVDYRNNKKHYRQHRHNKRRYTPGHRYDRAPSNWHRHGKRPGDWQRRGCIMVGPIWWCP